MARGQLHHALEALKRSDDTLHKLSNQCGSMLRLGEKDTEFFGQFLQTLELSILKSDQFCGMFLSLPHFLIITHKSCRDFVKIMSVNVR